MKKIIKAGAIDQTIDIFIQDSSSTTGAGLTGLAYNSASLVCYYRKGATGSATALTLATQTVGGAHSDGGFVEISSANMPGMYRLDLSDTIVATAGTVTLMLKGATNMAPLPIELQVVAYDPENATTLGLTNLDAAITTRLAPTTAGRTLDVSANGNAGLDWANIDAPTTVVNLSGTTVKTATDVETDTADIQTRIPAALVSGRIDASVGAMAAGVVTAASIAAAALNGKGDWLDAAGTRSAVGLAAANLDTQIGLLATAANLATVAGYLDTEIAAILEDTGTTLDTKMNSILSLLDDPRAEPGQAAPPVNPDMATKVDYLYKAWRNKKDNDGTTTNLYADDGTTVDHKQTTSEAAGTVTKGEWVSGP